MLLTQRSRGWRPAAAREPHYMRHAHRPTKVDRVVFRDTTSAAASVDAIPSGSEAGEAPEQPAPGASGNQTLSNIKWPKNLLGDRLQSLGITIVGEDTELNQAVGAAAAKRLGWFFSSTPKVLLGLHKAASLQELLQRDGADKLAEYEADMLSKMRVQKRVLVATIAGAAAARESTWPSLHGSWVVWLDEVNKASPKAKTAETALYAQRADMRLELKVVKGFSGKAAPSLEQRGKEAAELLIPKMKVFLDKQPDFVDRKKRYMEYGFRGDWPDIQPKEWNPVLDAFGRAGAAPAVTP